MSFWDSSAILPLLVSESGTPVLRALYGRDPQMVAWWGATVGCVSALARLERSGDLEAGAVSAAISQLRARLAELGARRIRKGGGYYWHLKPDYKPGDEIVL